MQATKTGVAMKMRGTGSVQALVDEVLGVWACGWSPSSRLLQSRLLPRATQSQQHACCWRKQEPHTCRTLAATHANSAATACVTTTTGNGGFSLAAGASHARCARVFECVQ
jgi:hypothetical protein